MGDELKKKKFWIKLKKGNKFTFKKENEYKVSKINLKWNKCGVVLRI